MALGAQDTGNKLHTLAFEPCVEPKTPATTCGLRASPKHSNKSYILEIGTLVRAEDTRNKIVHLSILLRSQNTGNKSYVFAFGLRFEPKTLAPEAVGAVPDAAIVSAYLDTHFINPKP